MNWTIHTLIIQNKMPKIAHARFESREGKSFPLATEDLSESLAEAKKASQQQTHDGLWESRVNCK
jgi:hypothetical protein